MNRKSLLALNTISSLTLQLVSIISGFIVPRLILQSYGSEVNGLINSVTQFLTIISFLELGVGAVIQSSLYKPLAEKDNEEISKIVVSGQKFFSKLAFILLIYVLSLIAIYPFVAKSNFGFLYTATMIMVISISSFAQYYFGIVKSLLITADQRGYYTYNIQTITLILNTIACFVLIRLGASIHAVKLSASLIYLIRPILISLYVKKNYTIDWEIKYSGEPIKQKWNGVAQHVAAVVLNGTDSIVLTLFTGLNLVSVYSVYDMITHGIRILINYSTNGIQSLIGNLLAKNEINKLKIIFKWVEWGTHTLTSYIFGVTAVLIIPFVEVYTLGINDASYIQYTFAILMILANAGCCYRLPYISIILAGGHYRQTQNNFIVAAILNISLSIILVYRFGLIGVAFGTLVAMFYQTIWMATYISKNMIHWPFRIFIKQMLVDFITLLSFLLIGKLLSIHATSWAAWIKYGFLISIVGLLLVIFINTLFYKSNILVLLNSLKNRVFVILKK